jgi:hypothetical protein
MIIISKLVASLGKIGRLFWELNMIVGGVTFLGLAMQMALALYMKDGHPWVRAALSELATVLTMMCALIWRLPVMFATRSSLDSQSAVLITLVILIGISQLAMWMTVRRRGYMSQSIGGIDRGQSQPQTVINVTTVPEGRTTNVALVNTTEDMFKSAIEAGIVELKASNNEMVAEHTTALQAELVNFRKSMQQMTEQLQSVLSEFTDLRADTRLVMSGLVDDVANMAEFIDSHLDNAIDDASELGEHCELLLPDDTEPIAQLQKVAAIRVEIKPTINPPTVTRKIGEMGVVTGSCCVGLSLPRTVPTTKKQPRPKSLKIAESVEPPVMAPELAREVAQLPPTEAVKKIKAAIQEEKREKNKPIPLTEEEKAMTLSQLNRKWGDEEDKNYDRRYRTERRLTPDEQRLSRQEVKRLIAADRRQ